MPGSSGSDAFDVVICGAGPGGSTAALCLKNTGLKVALLDQADFPRDKICGDALSGKVKSVLRHIDPNLAAALGSLPEKIGCYGIRFFSPDRSLLDIPFRSDLSTLAEAPGFVSRRIDFDHFLLQEALKGGQIQWFPHHPVRHLIHKEDYLEVHAGGSVFRARIVLGADGAHSVVAKELGLRNMDKRYHSAGVRAYVRGVNGFADPAFIELHYLRDLLPGYFWIFPLPNGAANVGLGMLSSDLAKKPLSLRKKLEEIIATHPDIAPRFAGATLEGPVQGFGLPLGSRKLPISANRCLLLGDAASLIDPFTGEGIGNAMVSGRIAARLIQRLPEESRFSAEDLRPYDEEIYQKLGPELRVSHGMQRLVRFPWLFDFFAHKAASNSSLRLLLTMMFESVDLRKTLTRPGFYWRLLVGGKKVGAQR